MVAIWPWRVSEEPAARNFDIKGNVTRWLGVAASAWLRKGKFQGHLYFSFNRGAKKIPRRFLKEDCAKETSKWTPVCKEKERETRSKKRRKRKKERKKKNTVKTVGNLPGVTIATNFRRNYSVRSPPSWVPFVPIAQSNGSTIGGQRYRPTPSSLSLGDAIPAILEHFLRTTLLDNSQGILI